MHLLRHLFDNIIDKGVSANYSTNPNESLRKPLRNVYAVSSKKSRSVDSEVEFWAFCLRVCTTNLPNEQILRTAHLQDVYNLLQSQIDLYNMSNHPKQTDANTDDSSVAHITLGSKQQSFQGIRSLEALYRHVLEF